MPLFRVVAGSTNVARARIALARALLEPMLQEEMRAIGQFTVDRLHAEAPRGKRESRGEPIEGDASGALADSFFWVQDGLSGAVLCDQPHKLDFVVNGRGPVRPVRKRALMWEGLDHPVKFARATEPNDFISPVLEEVFVEMQSAALLLLVQIANILGGV